MIFAIALIGAWQPSPAIGLLSALPGLYLLFEGFEFVASKLRSEGWHEVGIVEARNRSEAEIKYIAAHNEQELLSVGQEKRILQTKQNRKIESDRFVGLFPE